MKTVITYGSFDLLHYGHIRRLQMAASLGDRLIVGVSTDAFHISKGKSLVQPYWQRREIIESMTLVDLVIPEYSWEQKARDIEHYKADIIIIDKEWSGTFTCSTPAQLIFAERMPWISSSSLKKTAQPSSKT